MKLGRITALAAGAMSALFLSPPASFGWGRTWLGTSLEKSVASARWRLGPLRYDLGLRLDNAGYDSDIYFGFLPDRVPDATFVAGSNVSLYLPLSRGFVVSLNDTPQYLFFLERAKERGLNNSLRAQVHLALATIYLQATGAAANVKERMNSELLINVRRKTDELGGLALWQISRGTALALRFRHLSYDHENPADQGLDIRRNLDREESFLNATVYLLQRTKTRVYLEGERGVIAPKSPLSDFKDTQSLGVFGGIEFEPGAEPAARRRTLEGSVHAGYKRFSVRGSPFRDFSGWVGNAQVEARISKRTTCRWDLTRDIQFSAYATLGYYLQTDLGLGLSHSVSQGVSFSYGITRGWNRYAEIGTGQPGDPRKDDFLSHHAGLDFNLSEHFKLGVQANLSSRRSNRMDRDYRHGFVGVSVALGKFDAPSQLRSRFSR